MDAGLVCFRCGESLDYLSLPLSRRDECRACNAALHVCRMCRFYDANVPRQCTEDGAEDVRDKLKVNFCDWFKPGEGLFDAANADKMQQARNELDTLFGDSEADKSASPPGSDAAEDLFR